ncbi:MAG: hypothetical protein ACRD2C_01780 [Acidimicrobiales bacterium]
MTPRTLSVNGLVCVVLVAACSSGGDGDDGVQSSGGSHDPVGATTEASPFRVSHEPGGYRLVQAGQGSGVQDWGTDSGGTDEPVTVLAPSGSDPAGPDAVWVSVTGFAGYEGGLAQASSGYPSDDLESFGLDGEPAFYAPPSDDRRADLVVQVDDELAVRVSAERGSRESLADIARRVRPAEDRLLAPEVPDPPDDLAVVGSATADVEVTLVSRPVPASELLPASDRAYTAVWALGERGTPWIPDDGVVVVSTLPGQALDLDAVTAVVGAPTSRPGVTVTERDVGGRPGAHVQLATDGTDASNHTDAVFTSTPDGDLLTVVARGLERPAADELVAVASSVETATRQEWDQLVAQLQGPPGLHPDEGAVELERGRAGDVEWLFQARADGANIASSLDWDLEGQFVVDPCLKLSDGRRICEEPGGTEAGDWVAEHVPGPADGGPSFPGFVMVMTTAPAASVRLHTGDVILTAPSHPLPGDRHRGAVVLLDREPRLPASACTWPEAPPWLVPEPGRDHFELLDPGGQPLPCPT